MGKVNKKKTKDKAKKEKQNTEKIKKEVKSSKKLKNEEKKEKKKTNNSKVVKNTKKEKNPKNEKKKSTKQKKDTKKSSTKRQKKKTVAKKKFLSNDQTIELKRLTDLYSAQSMNDLKSLLKKNNQKISGNKGELVERCAQGKLLGAVPNCPQCSGGKLRFNINTGDYFCPGYVEDTTLIVCNFMSKDVKRNEWID